MISKDAVRRALTGPVASIRTPFNRDGSIDYQGVRSMVDFNIAAGSRTALLTAGDSHFTCLSHDEIAELARVIAEHTAGRAMVCAADWEYGTPQAVAFAKFCAQAGVDILMLRAPDWGASVTVESLVEHYAAVAEHIPVMLVTNIFGTRGNAFGLQVVRELLAKVPGIMALKEDMGGDFACHVSMLAHKQWAIFSGGGLRFHMQMHPYGCDGFMDRHMNFQPRIAHDYWAAVQAGDLTKAVDVIRDIEVPLENFMGAFPGGRDAAVHGLLEIYGVAGRWRRKPYHSLTDEEMARLKAFMGNMKLL